MADKKTAKKPVTKQPIGKGIEPLNTPKRMRPDLAPSKTFMQGNSQSRIFTRNVRSA